MPEEHRKKENKTSRSGLISGNEAKKRLRRFRKRETARKYNAIRETASQNGGKPEPRPMFRMLRHARELRSRQRGKATSG